MVFLVRLPYVFSALRPYLTPPTFPSEMLCFFFWSFFTFYNFSLIAISISHMTLTFYAFFLYTLRAFPLNPLRPFLVSTFFFFVSRWNMATTLWSTDIDCGSNCLISTRGLIFLFRFFFFIWF